MIIPNISWLKDTGEFGEGVFNGDIGIVEEIDKISRRMQVRFKNEFGTLIVAPLQKMHYSVPVKKSRKRKNPW